VAERSKAVFLDRDGVINLTVFRKGAHRAPQDMSEWAYVEGVQTTLAALKARGYVLLVCTNQPDVPRGWQDRDQVVDFHAKIEAELPVSRVYACFHDDAHDCACRKPKPGMLVQGSEEFDIDLSQSWMVGDRSKDIEAGKAAGCRTIYLRHDHDSAPSGNPDHEITKLEQLLEIIR
jgi:D-glycero-D-manno-heptose 1,7-bisphosphate phosphatase